MRIFRSAFLTAALAATFASGVARAQAIPFDIEAGYRFVSVTGNEGMYRSQIDEREGFLIRSLHVAIDENSSFKLADKIRIDGSDLGAGGAGFLRLDAGLGGVYRLQFTYRYSELFSALPGFANPLGAAVGQQTWDRQRNQFNVDLEILPGKVITPIVGYTSNTMHGPGTTTYHFGEDEFRLAQDLWSSDQEFRVGAAFNAGVVSGEVIQGWRKYHETENDTLAPFAGPGNNTTPILGKTISANSLTSSSVTDINTPVTSAFVRAFALPNLQISGFYVRANASGDDGTQTGASGSFASYAISRFFTGLSGVSTTSPTSLTFRAGLRAEWHVSSGVDVSAGYTERDQNWDNKALLSNLYTGTSTFTGFSLADFQSLLTTQTNLDNREKVFDVQVSTRVLGPVGLRIGYSRINQDLTVEEDPAEIVVPGGQSGLYSRAINRYEGAVTFSAHGLNLMGEASYDDADAAITRVDYRTRNRERVRLTWKSLDWLTLGASGFFLDQKNDDAGPLNTYKATARNYTADLTLNPTKWLHVRGAWARLKSDSSLPIRLPQDFTVVTPVTTEDGDLWEAGAGFKWKQFAVDGFWSRFNNDGSYLFRMVRGGARADWDATVHAGLAVEWSVDRYLDLQNPLSASNSYRADRYGVYLKWRP